MSLKFCYARGIDPEEYGAMREALAKSPLRDCGDAVLVWVSQGELLALEPPPTDVTPPEPPREDRSLKL